nr:hypothetical protein [Kofleriaceae bacterium]
MQLPRSTLVPFASWIANSATVPTGRFCVDGTKQASGSQNRP